MWLIGANYKIVFGFFSPEGRNFLGFLKYKMIKKIHGNVYHYNAKLEETILFIIISALYYFI